MKYIKKQIFDFFYNFNKINHSEVNRKFQYSKTNIFNFCWKYSKMRFITSVLHLRSWKSNTSSTEDGTRLLRNTSALKINAYEKGVNSVQLWITAWFTTMPANLWLLTKCYMLLGGNVASYNLYQRSQPSMGWKYTHSVT